MSPQNPFALVRASDYTDEQVNSLWVELGPNVIDSIIEPLGGVSKFILGGKGTGKTHLLRYLSYPVIRLRQNDISGIETLKNQKFLAVFVRAAGLDAAKFILSSEHTTKWQQLFAIYFELTLVETLLHSICEIKITSPAENFDDNQFLKVISKSIISNDFNSVLTVSDFYDWVLLQKRKIDEAINNAAFSGILDIHIAFSLGSLCIPIAKALKLWHPAFHPVPLIYLIDEIENFSSEQQEVINSLIRYAESNATFRVTGRLYGMKTLATMGNGEENRQGSEFKTVVLDDVLRKWEKFTEFAGNFLKKRLASVGMLDEINISKEFDPRTYFEEIETGNFYSKPISDLKISIFHIKDSKNSNVFAKEFGESSQSILGTLTDSFPLILQKLSVLLFCKRYKKGTSPFEMALQIRNEALLFLTGDDPKGRYATAYSHWAGDLFAQLCRESSKEENVPYAGFDNFIRMSSNNPRNLLIILGKAYSSAYFKGINFIQGNKLSVSMQSRAVIEAAKYMFETDTNLGVKSEQAKNATQRLANLLRTARYALNIPEVSPLAFSFEEEGLNPDSKHILKLALNFSFIYEIHEGRPDRNTQKINKKYQLNPLLAPYWGLPISRRGDLNLNPILLNSIFDPKLQNEFDVNLNALKARWDNPFRVKHIKNEIQIDLI